MLVKPGSMSDGGNSHVITRAIAELNGDYIEIIQKMDGIAVGWMCTVDPENRTKQRQKMKSDYPESKTFSQICLSIKWSSTI